MTKKQLQALCKKLTRLEGKKVQVSRANMQEVMAAFADLAWKSPVWIERVYTWGEKRASREK